jgi:hypothetical protein
MRGLRRYGWLLGLLALLACGPDPVPGLRVERQKLLASTLPKKDFWDAVERKAALLKKKEALDGELDTVKRQQAALDAERAQVEAVLANARQVNDQAAQVLAHDRAEMERLEGEVAKRESTLTAFSDRGRSAGTGAAPAGPGPKAKP